MTPKQAKALIGLRIIAVRLNEHEEGDGAHTVALTQPLIFLEDGSVLYFFSQEHPEGADAGVGIGLLPKKKGKKK